MKFLVDSYILPKLQLVIANTAIKVIMFIISYLVSQVPSQARYCCSSASYNWITSHDFKSCVYTKVCTTLTLDFS